METQTKSLPDAGMFKSYQLNTTEWVIYNNGVERAAELSIAEAYPSIIPVCLQRMANGESEYSI
jgi:hypothetical protein